MNNFLNWLFTNKDILDLQVQELTGLNAFVPGIFDFRVTIKYQDQEYSGRGIDFNQEKSLIKAAAEAIERIFCDDNEISTNGVAIHDSLEQATLNAKLELIERDSFFCHYLTKTPFIHLDSEPSSSRFDFKKIKKLLLSKLGVTIEIRRLHTDVKLGDKKANIFLVYSYGDFGLNLGLGTHYNLEVALEKALMECLRNTIGIIHSNVKSIGLSDFQSKPKHDSIDHIKLTLDKDYLAKIKFLFEDANVNFKQNQEEHHITTTELSINDPLFTSIPLKVVQSKCNSLQDAFWGPTNIENINLKRLQEFSEIKTLTFDDLNLYPHPLG